jgi:hypothetical protein
VTDAKLPVWTQVKVSAATHDEIERLLADVCWHDSVVHSITLVRAASADEVVVVGPLLYDWDLQRSCLARVTFGGCFRVTADLQWGVDCMSDGEMIGSLEFSAVHPEVDAIRQEWPQRKLPALFHLELDLSSTGSSLRLVFQSLTVEPIAPAGPHSAPPPLLPGGSREPGA